MAGIRWGILQFQKETLTLHEMVCMRGQDELCNQSYGVLCWAGYQCGMGSGLVKSKARTIFWSKAAGRLVVVGASAQVFSETGGTGLVFDFCFA